MKYPVTITRTASRHIVIDVEADDKEGAYEAAQMMIPEDVSDAMTEEVEGDPDYHVEVGEPHPVKPVKQEWKVPMERHTVQTAIIRVEADNELEAQRLAHDKAGNFDYGSLTGDGFPEYKPGQPVKVEDE